VVQAVEVDQCAIALPEEGEPNQLRIVATYNPRREGRGEAITFPVSDQPAIKYAIDRQREVEINSGYETPQLKFLFAMMGAREEAGPLIIQPLVLHNRSIGVLIVGNAYSKQPFGPTKAQLIKTMANQVAVAVDNAQAYHVVLTKSQQLAWTLRNQEQDAGRRRAAMEAELKKNREEVSLISQRLYEQEMLTRKSQKELTEYQQRINQLNEQIKLAHGKLERVMQENRRLAGMTESHKKQIDQLTQAEEALETLRTRLGELEIRASEAEKLEIDLEATQERSRKLAKALRLSRAKLQQLAGVPSLMTSAQANAELESLSCGVLITDSLGTINRVNDASTKLLDGISVGLVGKKLGEIVRDEAWTQAIKKIEQRDEELVSVNFTAGEKFIKATISPMVDSGSNQISGNVVILYDITEEFESQQARDEFVASLSQDLRTPMTSITGYIDLLLGESVGMIGDMQRKFLQRVKANIERMELMLRDLIGVTAIDAGQFEIKPVQIDLAEIIEDAIIGAKAQLEEKEIQPFWEIPEKLPFIEADPDCMHQVMANLLGNATKVTPVGGTISVTAIVTNGDGSSLKDNSEQRWLQVSVADSGGGIAEKDRDRVFDRFYQAERPLIQGLGETGVGLSIVKYLVEAHGGKVWLDTEMGHGSTFYFQLAIPDFYNDPWQEIDVPPLDLSPDDADL
jgi:signal transduction histidine kinase